MTVVEIPPGSGNRYRYEYEEGATVYKGPVGTAPELSEGEFLEMSQVVGQKERKLKTAFEILDLDEQNRYDTGLGDVDYDVMSDPPQIALWMGIDNPLSDFEEEGYHSGEYEVSQRDQDKMGKYFEENYKGISFDPSHLNKQYISVWFTIEPTMPPDTKNEDKLREWFDGEMNRAFQDTGANSFRNDFLIYGEKLEFD